MRATEDKTTGGFEEVWPALPQAEWSDSCATLQLWMQVVGKVRLALTPAVNHTWNVTLYPTVRGLTTSPMPHGGRMLQIDFDFIDHVLLLQTSDGGRATIALGAMTVAAFYGKVMAALDGLGTPVRIWRKKTVPGLVALIMAATTMNAGEATRRMTDETTMSNERLQNRAPALNDAGAMSSMGSPERSSTCDRLVISS